MVMLHDFGQRADNRKVLVEFVEQCLYCRAYFRVCEMTAVPRGQKIHLVHSRVCNVYGIESGLGRKEPSPNQFRRYEVYLGAVCEDTHASHGHQPLGGHRGIAAACLDEHNFRGYQFVAVAVPLPACPRDGLLFREIAVR